MADTTKMKKEDTFGGESRNKTSDISGAKSTGFGDKSGSFDTSGGLGDKSGLSGSGESSRDLSGTGSRDISGTGSRDTSSGEDRSGARDDDKGFGGNIQEVKDNVKSFVSGKARNLMDQVGVENWDDVKQGARDAVQRARDIATDVAGRAQEQASQAVDDVGGLVRRYPFQSVLIGFGIGCLIGAALSPSRRAA